MKVATCKVHPFLGPVGTYEMLKINEIIQVQKTIVPGECTVFTDFSHVAVPNWTIKKWRKESGE